MASPSLLAALRRKTESAVPNSEWLSGDPAAHFFYAT
jgi:hypothetical protein